MRLLVLAAFAAVTVADVSHLTGYQYNRPASSYGVPQNSVTEKYFLNPVTAPTFGLHLPILEHQDFNSQIGISNPGFIFSTTPAPIIDSGIAVSTTPAPIVDSGIAVSTTPAPSVDSGIIASTTPAPSVQVGTGFGYTTPVPDLQFNAGFISSTPTPSVSVTSGSQESLNINPQLPSLGFNPGFNFYSTPAPSLFSTPAPSIFSTPAPNIFSTPAPSVSLNSGLNFGPGLNFPDVNLGYNFGLGGFSTPAPIFFGSGGSLNDAAFGVSTPGPIVSSSASVYSQTPQITKHVYFYAAPEEPELPRPRINIIRTTPPRKNVKIIFIKSPSPPPPAPIRIAAPPPDEEKTIVYVLVRKPEEQQDIELQTPPPTPPSRPEIYFIKYRTQQEAEQAISQAQENHAVSEPHLSADSVNGGGFINSISGESLVTPQPIINYVTSSTPAPISLFSSLPPQPIFNYVTSTTPAPIFSGFDGTGFASNFNLVPQLNDADISQNLISSSLFSTASPVTVSPVPVSPVPVSPVTVSPIAVSAGESGLIESTTPAPIVPHVTYGPPGFKK
ncbi:hypothetical protein NQ314_011774 [Rhamnusium bicolor]|uniref:DUF243 domain-containing protein n=1 Tax=Rhamnusium bicolor TaxID=1586634 RepID=A0AAV8XGM2_9CUCU|nr:hypothetical protein NQ314_011774 [Rhamnusium bicolor]